MIRTTLILAAAVALAGCAPSYSGKANITSGQDPSQWGLAPIVAPPPLAPKVEVDEKTAASVRASLSGFGGSSGSSPGIAAIIKKSIPARDITKSEKLAIAAAVQAQLKDPEAAKFIWPSLVNEEIYCGVVNGKNSYGGYVGDTPFIVGLTKGAKGNLKPASLDIGKPRDDTPTTGEIIKFCREVGYALVLDSGLPSALVIHRSR